MTVENHSRRAFLLGPIVFLLCLGALLLTWAVMEPQALHRAFDNDGHAPFELATIPFFAAIIPLVWWKCPFGGSPVRRAVLCSAVSCVAFFAVCKELDWHITAMTALYPDVVANFKGTPFKMRFLTSSMTNGAQALPIPWGAKALAVAYFGLFFGLFAALLAYYAWPLLRGIFTLHPVAWTMCCFGTSGVMVQICDRLPAWIRHARGLPKSDVIDATSSFCTCLEEGGEMMIALFALIAIVQSHRLIARTRD